MPGFPDATGYLLQLRDQENKNWFSYICDLSVSATSNDLENDKLDKLVKFFLGEEQYTSIVVSSFDSFSPISASISGSTTTPRKVHLKELCQFKNFKKLSPELKLIFEKPLTVIFGANASGKSSLCEAIKILAYPNRPDNPISNAQSKSNDPPQFSYLFTADIALNNWNQIQGYGKYALRIKYFDSSIALAHLTNSLQPEKIVEIAPFRIEVFTYCGTLIRNLQSKLNEMISAKGAELSRQIENLTAKFTALLLENGEDAISKLSESDFNLLIREYKSFTRITQEDIDEHNNSLQALNRLNQASTEEGLRLLKAELASLREYGKGIKRFIKLTKSSPLTEVKQLLENLERKRITQQTLSQNILPEGVELEDFKSFLISSKNVFDYDNIDRECPFCRKTIDDNVLPLIEKYKEFLTSQLEIDIRKLINLKNEKTATLNTVREFTQPEIAPETNVLPGEFYESINQVINSFQEQIPVDIHEIRTLEIQDIDVKAKLKESIGIIGHEIRTRYRTIKTTETGDDKIQEERTKLSIEIHAFNYKSKFQNESESIKTLLETYNEKNKLEQKNRTGGFPSMLAKVTTVGKKAYNDLVVDEFKDILNKEYLALSQRNLDDFGINFRNTGSQQTVILNSAVGDVEIHRIFSEGEQKIHSLALFFSEARVGSQDVIVFDDPVTSFDYNNMGFYTKRLRDFFRDHPEKQIIVLTHNWDFFVLLQSTINKSSLNCYMSVMVLEDCSWVAEYSEKIDNIKNEIDSILTGSGEPKRDQKENLSGCMRRLIEVIVNTHVFNNQRHQFKQKSLPVSDFHHFTKLVPLENAEADKLKDLYSDLSISEHDDPRNCYIFQPKSVFQRWYDEIEKIESNLITRKPA